MKLDKRSMSLVVSKHQVSTDLSSDTSDSIVILNLKDGVYYELEKVAAHVWKLIQQPCSIQSILEILIDEYEVDTQQCEADLMTLIEDLSKKDLVEIITGHKS